MMESAIMGATVGLVCGIFAAHSGQKLWAGLLASVIITILINIIWSI